MSHGEKCKRRKNEKRETPPFDSPVQANEKKCADKDGGENAAEQHTARTDDAIQRQRDRETCRERGKPADLLRAVPQHRIRQRRRDAQAVVPARAQSPEPQPEVAQVVGAEKHAEHEHRSATETEHRQCEQTAERQPTSPDQPIADAAERTAGRRSKTLNSLRRLTLSFYPQATRHDLMLLLVAAVMFDAVRAGTL